MRILTVRQPWAWAIIHGGKDVENRKRNIAGDYRGPIAIHAGLAWDRFWPEDGPLEDAMLDEMHRRRHRKPWPWNEHRGAIIGVVDLTDVHHAHTCPTALEDRWPVCSHWAERGDIYHLVLERPRALATPIPYRGMLGLRRFNETVDAQIIEALA